MFSALLSMLLFLWMLPEFSREGGGYRCGQEKPFISEASPAASSPPGSILLVAFWREFSAQTWCFRTTMSLLG